MYLGFEIMGIPKHGGSIVWTELDLFSIPGSLDGLIFRTLREAKYNL